MQQQSGRGKAVVGVFLDQRACGQDGGFVYFFQRHTIVEIAQGFLHDGFSLDISAQPRARGLDQVAQTVHVECDTLVAIDDMQRRGAGRLGFGLACALLGAAFAVQHVGASDLVVFAAHQAQLHLVLHIFNVEGAAARTRTHERAYHGLRELIHHLAHAGRGCTLGAVHRQKGFHHGDGNLLRDKRHHGAVAPEDLVVR